MEEFIGNYLKLVPDSLRFKLLCKYYNCAWGRRKINNNIMHDFRIEYKNNFIVFFDNITLKFDYNPYYDIIGTPIKLYLKRYKQKKGDIIIDGGACTGIFSLIASKLVGEEGTVIAFEPDPLNYEKLINNINLNNINNIIPINKGLWSKNTTLEFNNVGNFGSTFIIDGEMDSYSKIEVEVVSLDSILKEYKIDYIKLDIEGSEIEAIKGSRNTLKSNDVNLAVASYHLVKGVKTCFQLKEILEKLGYKTKIDSNYETITYACKY